MAKEKERSLGERACIATLTKEIYIGLVVKNPKPIEYDGYKIMAKEAAIKFLDD